MASGKRLIFRVSDEEHQRIEAMATALCVTVSDFVRDSVTLHLKAREQLQPSPHAVSIPAEKWREAYAHTSMNVSLKPGAVNVVPPNVAPGEYAEQIAAGADSSLAVGEDLDEDEPVTDEFDESELQDFNIPQAAGNTSRGPVRVGRNEEPEAFDDKEPTALSIRRAPRKSGKDWTLPPDERTHLRPNPIAR